MRDEISAVLMIVGAVFAVIASIGMLRMPDLFLRMSSSTKASTLGVGTILVSASVYFGELGVISRSMATIAFVLLTVPVAAHVLGRAGYRVGVTLSDRTVRDDLRGQYGVRLDEEDEGPEVGLEEM
jgi:multicomponent Na+:H+ antiporter subunit G